MKNEVVPIDMYREMHEKALLFYKDQLKRSPRAITYLKERGVNGETARAFGIGYAPDNRQALREIFTNYQVQSLVDCGLVIVNDKGQRFDRFRDRIMFPIHDESSRVIGFGSRVIEQGFAKYLNSPETALFKKRSVLYGYAHALPHIQETGTAIVVEGYMDVAMLAQHGIRNSVAALGTATTSDHFQLLKKVAQKIVFCFDDDNAGREAARKAMDLSIDQVGSDTQVQFMFLPNGHDPDSFIRERGAQAFLTQLKQAVPMGAFLMRKLKENRHLKSCEGRAGLVADAIPYIKAIVDPVLKSRMIAEVAKCGRLTTDELLSFIH